ncbi:amino acid ABC transporter substrate-binding protein [Brasilonema sp. CT11]|nr:amino acid ABC transporter substrate-binding protein [Brasilonema sp. CT11]
MLEWQKSRLQENDIKIYTLAVVVPFHHNQGRVAVEVLQGIAQIQLQINLQSLGLDYLKKQELLSTIIPDNLYVFKNVGNQIALRFLIVNDPNKLYNPHNQTAESLANLALSLNLMAILGHYSSEMTKRALSFYSEKGLTLVNYSSTSNQLSSLEEDEKLCFFRLTTQDSINAKQLINYLAEINSIENYKKVAIIYNKNSSFSISYRNSIKKAIDQYSRQFIVLSECDYLSEDYYQIQEYLSDINQQSVDIIIVIPDGGIEPNSLNNTALISRLNLKKCLIAGSATFYQENVLHWMHEHHQDNSINSNRDQIIACIPWHWNSQINGCNSANIISQQFCRVGAQLWGEENLTWRSATAFDAVFIILRVLERTRNQAHQPLLNSRSLIEQMDQYYKKQQSAEQGVTGTIKFDENGDRIEPPSEIVTVKWNPQQQKWKWSHLRSM